MSHRKILNQKAVSNVMLVLFRNSIDFGEKTDTIRVNGSTEYWTGYFYWQTILIQTYCVPRKSVGNSYYVAGLVGEFLLFPA